MGKAKFFITCEQIGFSRSMEIPIDTRGHVHDLSDDLAKAMDFYRLKIENHKLKQTILGIKNGTRSLDRIYELIEELEQTVYLGLT